MPLNEAYSLYLPWIEAALRAFLAEPAPLVARHYGMMQYHMGWRDTDLRPAEAPTGKRIRPMLCLLACAASGGDPQQAVPAAAGLELLHNFSLIHDDIEDEGETRHHRPALWRVFGTAQAINAGDAMFSVARLAVSDLAGRGVPAETVLAALRTFDRMCLELTEGQFLDMAFENRPDVSVAEYFAMIERKTAALLAAAPQIGALVAGAGPEPAVAYARFGRSLGLAFQLQDDVLGIWGSEELTGKSAASDILSKKKSLPVLIGLADPTVGPRLAARYHGPAFTEADVPAVLALLDEAHARQQTEAQVARLTAEAQAALAEAQPASQAGAALAELLAMLAGRSA